MDSFLTRRSITSANRSATVITRILSLFSFNGMVSVTISSVNFELLMRSNAGPDNTACVQKARTLFAPFSMNSSAALVKVPAVSHMSSTKSHLFLPRHRSQSFLPLRLLFYGVCDKLPNRYPISWHRHWHVLHHLHPEQP